MVPEEPTIPRGLVTLQGAADYRKRGWGGGLSRLRRLPEGNQRVLLRPLWGGQGVADPP